jgi:hypothetical protein
MSVFEKNLILNYYFFIFYNHFNILILKYIYIISEYFQAKIILKSNFYYTYLIFVYCG